MRTPDFEKTGHQYLLVNNLQIFAKWSRDKSLELLTQHLYFTNVEDDEIFMCAKFWFSAIIYAKVIANKSFSKGKYLSHRP